MLFNLCNCVQPSSLAADMGALCSGGTGFVTAMMATLAAAARTKRAKTLRGDVPQVDKLTVRMVTDNIALQFVPDQKLEGLSVERRVGRLEEPDKPPRHTVNGEWGLAMYAQSFMGNEERNVMIDFGFTPEVLNNNMAVLGVAPSTFDAMVLSHGHYDHFGGMVGFLDAHKSALKRRMPFYVGGEDCFCIRRTPGGSFGALDRKVILDADLMLMTASEPAIVADHAFTTGRIGQVSFEKPLQPSSEIVGIVDGFGCFPDDMPPQKNTGDYVLDDFDHEIATVYRMKGKGLVVPTSCSHRGVINTVRQAMKSSGVDKVHAVVGGFHIVPPLGDEYIHRTIDEFKAIDPDYLITAHCTGERFYDLARAAFGDKVIRSAVGTRFVFTTE
jgi:7,8-dihydropterin-6-yl-methyl-4-(beta-D-ribofuranosyl)aminobenzene 5'-phosphate synthase